MYFVLALRTCRLYSISRILGQHFRLKVVHHCHVITSTWETSLWKENTLNLCQLTI